MQLPFFYQEALPDGAKNFMLSAETSRHVVQVLRTKEGESFILTDGKGIEMTVKLVHADKKEAEVEFVSKVNHLAPDNEITIAISLLKNENRFEWFIEKAGELGIYKIIPIICSRTEKKKLKTERLHSILVSAMLQSRQNFLSQLAAPTKLGDLFELEGYQQKLIAHCIENVDKAELENIVEKDASKLVLIGPEGDFTPGEVEKCVGVGFLPVSLGATRLRTETAGIVAAVLLQNKISY